MSLKVLVLTHHFSPTTETFIYHDVVAMQEYAQVKLVCFYRENEELRPFHSLQKVSYQRSRLQRKYHNLLYKFNISLNFRNRSLKEQLSKILEDFQPDVLHFHFGIQALYFLDNLSFEGPIFLTFHGYDATKLVKKSAIYRMRLKELMNRENFFPLATSASLFDYMATYGIQSERSKVLYSGIKMDLFHLPANPIFKDEILFTQISSFRAKKGHYYLVQAFAELVRRHSDKKLLLILTGRGPLEEEIKNEVFRLKIHKLVKFTGWIDQKEAVELLAKTDVFVHPSITTPDGDRESTTVAILEAMAMELPIFSTYHSGIPEIVEDGVNGLLATEKNVNSYVNCLEKLMSWGKLSHNRQKILDHYSHKQHVQKLFENYREAQLSLSQ